jgi:hypothetical protein
VLSLYSVAYKAALAPGGDAALYGALSALLTALLRHPAAAETGVPLVLALQVRPPGSSRSHR